MILLKNKNKFKIFLQIAEGLNKSLDFTPILYGSLGLNRIIGDFYKVNDIDILVPDEFIHKKWNMLLDFMHKLNFKLKDIREHEFIKNANIINFATNKDLFKYTNAKPEQLEITQVGHTKFKELSLKQYLAAYAMSLKDSYRQNKKDNEDHKRIKQIKRHLREK